jgi:UDP-3-O-acyl-N-acetylglucosamine deacetylase
MDSVLVIGRSDFVTPQRMDEEPVRHKAMDLIGDLALLDCGLQAHVLARRSGHRLHAQLVQAIQEKAVFD